MGGSGKARLAGMPRMAEGPFRPDFVLCQRVAFKLQSGTDDGAGTSASIAVRMGASRSRRGFAGSATRALVAAFASASRGFDSGISEMPARSGKGFSSFESMRGPGYRVYFGREGATIVILLCGGDKGTQEQDIERAKQYWRDHRSGSNGSA